MLGPCTACGTPYTECAIDWDDPLDDELCCEDCQHLITKETAKWFAMGTLMMWAYKRWKRADASPLLGA